VLDLIPEPVKAVLLVGGMGTRLRPLTYRIPKPLVPVVGRPLIMRVIDSLPKEVDEIIVPMSYKKEAMEEYLVRNRPKRKITLVDEPEPLGTGGAVKNVEDHLDGEFLVVNGDSVSSLDVSKFIRFHKSKSAFATISLWPVEDVTPFGVVDLDDNARIRRFQEKPKKEEAFSNLINAGVYALNHEVLSYIGKGFVSMEREVFPKILEKGMYGFRFDGYWIDCGIKKSVHEGAELRTPFAIRDEAVVAGATIGPRAYLSERVVVGHKSVVQDSVIFEDARIGTGCRIHDSVIDAGVTVPDGEEVVSKILSNARPEGT
jgi:mannose-1-phosphate guanylyltransferase